MSDRQDMLIPALLTGAEQEGVNLSVCQQMNGERQHRTPTHMCVCMHARTHARTQARTLTCTSLKDTVLIKTRQTERQMPRGT